MMKYRYNQRNQTGFTIIELMIATVIFSLVLMVCLAGIMQITKMYYRTVTQNKTREVARSIIDELGESLRYSSAAYNSGSPVIGPQIELSNDNYIGYFCVGQKRYSYAIDRQVSTKLDAERKQIKHALWVDTSQCDGPADLNSANSEPSANGADLVPENMRLFKLSISNVDSSNSVYRIEVGVAYGDDDLLFPKPEENPTELTCEGAINASEFCATVILSETVQKRL
ncbi:prepilin-type N-terminal cleavage/methylation domain-containing protein [Candidatus Saccharibacteria bacterium]|nr:prepilin-type N-terminal cleavage/methylation domain-containing protein [Candidatus Saccharibacteria bacterium]